jgi:hypothetical protein
MKAKTMLRGAFTVAAPKKRLRAWVGIPVILGTGLGALPLQKTIKSLVLADRPVAAAAVSTAVGLAVGAAMTAHPYTRWAGVVVLGWSALTFATSSYTFGTQAVKDAYNILGRAPVQILGGR